MKKHNGIYGWVKTPSPRVRALRKWVVYGKVSHLFAIETWIDLIPNGTWDRFDTHGRFTLHIIMLLFSPFKSYVESQKLGFATFESI